MKTTNKLLIAGIGIAGVLAFLHFRKKYMNTTYIIDERTGKKFKEIKKKAGKNKDVVVFDYSENVDPIAPSTFKFIRSLNPSQKERFRKYIINQLPRLKNIQNKEMLRNLMDMIRYKVSMKEQDTLIRGFIDKENS